MKLYDHQQKIIDADPKKCGLFLGTGSGKTRIALLLAQGRILVICPKTQKEDQNWIREALAVGLGGNGRGKKILTVVSKEEFRRDWQKLIEFQPMTIIVDEAHTCLGVTPTTLQRNRQIIPKASQLFEALDAYIKITKPDRLYLCTATIVRSPMTVYAAAKLLGKEIGYYKFRDRFYVRLPMPGREVYTPKHDSASKELLASLVRKLGFVGRLEDYFDVPDQVYRTIHTELTNEQKDALKKIKLQYPDPIVYIGKRHMIENGVLSGDEFSLGQEFSNNKIEAIKELALEFPRMVIFAKYRMQINQIAREMEKMGKKVLTLTGDTKDRGSVILEANKTKECIFIAQAQVSAGWELPEYPTTVFASCTYSFVDRIQAEGRIQRVNNIKKNLYIDLIVKGGVDEAVQKCIANKKDFDARIYLNL